MSVCRAQAVSLMDCLSRAPIRSENKSGHGWGRSTRNDAVYCCGTCRRDAETRAQHGSGWEGSPARWAGTGSGSRRRCRAGTRWSRCRRGPRSCGCGRSTGTSGSGSATSRSPCEVTARLIRSDFCRTTRSGSATSRSPCMVTARLIRIDFCRTTRSRSGLRHHTDASLKDCHDT